jgi:hypothetical protein
VEYDPLLNPTRAEVGVSLQVVAPPDLGSDLMIGAYKYTQGVKEVMAALNLANSAALAASINFSVAL